MSKVTFGQNPGPLAGISLLDWADGATAKLMSHRPIENHQPVDWNNDPIVVYARCARGIVVRPCSSEKFLEELPKCKVCHSGQPALGDQRKTADDPHKPDEYKRSEMDPDSIGGRIRARGESLGIVHPDPRPVEGHTLNPDNALHTEQVPEPFGGTGCGDEECETCS